MSSATPPAGTGSTDASAAPGRHVTSPSDLAGRGTTRIEPRVVERVAAQAVREVDQAAGTARSVLGMNLGGGVDDSTGADVTADVDGSTAIVDVTMSVSYPASVREVTRNTRTHIVERVKELTGVDVQQVDITVAGMTVARPDTPRVR